MSVKKYVCLGDRRQAREFYWLETVLGVNTSGFKKSTKAEGVLLCLFNSQNGYQHTFTVWQSKKEMLAYKSSSVHDRAMKGLPKIGSGRVYSYDTIAMPSWDEALAEWKKMGERIKTGFKADSKFTEKDPL